VTGGGRRFSTAARQKHEEAEAPASLSLLHQHRACQPGRNGPENWRNSTAKIKNLNSEGGGPAGDKEGKQRKISLRLEVAFLFEYLRWRKQANNDDNESAKISSRTQDHG